MKILEVPVFNEDKSIKLVLQMHPEEAQHILQFAMNFLVSSGMVANYALLKPEEEGEQGDLFADMTKPQ